MVKKLRGANYSDEDIRKAFRMQHDRMIRSVRPADLAWYHTFGDKAFFAFILISTIGYGNVVPKSSYGKILCVVYSMIGLPLHEIMMRLLSVKFRGGLKETFKIGLKVFPRSRIILAIMAILFYLFWTAIFLVIPAFLIMIKEKWDYHHAFYFSYVSLTTIGLGDYVASVSDSTSEGAIYALMLILTLIWMFFGLGFVTMAVNMLSYVMGIYTFDNLDSKCRERTTAMRKFNVLLELMKELNWQLVKGKPDDFEDWDEIENFKNLLAENPQDVTPALLQKMFDIIQNLKEKAYDQVHRGQFGAIPTSRLLRHARGNIPEILSAESVTINTVSSKSSKGIPNAPGISQSVQESSRNSDDRQDRNAASHSSFVHTGSFEQHSSRESPGSSVHLNVADIGTNDIIEDRTEYLHDEEKDSTPKESEVKADDEDKSKD